MIGRPLPPCAPGFGSTIAARVAAALLTVAAVVTPVAAQRILGPGDDAVTLQRGAFRVGFSGEHTVQRDRWRDGRLEGLGGALTGDTFGPTQFSLLSPLQQLVRDLGVSNFAASLGASRADVRQRLFITPLSLEYGVANWLTLGVSAPLVRTSTESQFRIRGDSGRATLGMNPFFAGTAVASANLATIGRYGQASSDLGARRDACVASVGAAPECPILLAELTAVNALVTSTSRFASGLTTLYGAGASRGQRYVPMAGSAAETVLLARVDSLRLALVRYGITDVTIATGLPLGAQTPLTAADLDRLVRDSTDGYGARALRSAGLTSIGDVTVAAKVRLFDTFAKTPLTRFAATGFGWRQSVLVQYRIGTGTRERADALVDQGSGTGTNALTVRSLSDLILTRRVWTTMAVGITKAAPDVFRLRVPSIVGSEWLESWREADVSVTPGTIVEADVAPRWQLSDYIALGALWRWRRKSADRHAIDSIVTTPLGAPATLLGSVLDAASAAEEHRVGWTATYSTLAARARGLPGAAVEFSYSHLQSIASSRGIVPKRWEDRVQIRYYTRFLGR